MRSTATSAFSPPFSNWPWIGFTLRPQGDTHAVQSGQGVLDTHGRRLVHLYAGPALYGEGVALQLRAGLGLDPWDVFHQDLSEHTGLSIGTVSMVVGAAVLPLWWPLQQRPGLGTVSNTFVVGLPMDTALRLLPQQHAMGVRTPLLAAAIVLTGVGLYSPRVSARAPATG
jgi:uncharacterized membrane protein YczE